MVFLPIQSEAEHIAALKEVAALMEKDPEPGTPEGRRLDVLVTQVQVYEAVQTPMDAPQDGQHHKP